MTDWAILLKYGVAVKKRLFVAHNRRKYHKSMMNKYQNIR